LAQRIKEVEEDPTASLEVMTGYAVAVLDHACIAITEWIGTYGGGGSRDRQQHRHGERHNNG
jgi:hypothetical protein